MSESTLTKNRMAVPGGDQELNLPSISSQLQVNARECGDRRGEFDTLSNLLLHNYFQLTEFSEPDVFSVLGDPKWTSLPHVFVQPLPKPTKKPLCTYSFHWQEVSQAYHHNFSWFCFAPSSW